MPTNAKRMTNAPAVPAASHRMGLWADTTVLVDEGSAERVGKVRECVACGAEEVVARGVGFADRELAEPCRGLSLSPLRLYEYGRAITGLEEHEGWVRQLANMLPVSAATMRRWASGNRPAPQWVDARLRELCIIRRDEIERVLKAADTIQQPPGGGERRCSDPRC